MKIDAKLMYNIPLMDNEHTELLFRAEKLMQAYQNGDPDHEIIKLLSFLKDYVHEHFEHEEALQRENQYPQYLEHQKIHAEFKKDIEFLYKDVFENGLTMMTRLKLGHATSEWILHHIGEEDKKLADFLHNHEDKPIT